MFGSVVWLVCLFCADPADVRSPVTNAAARVVAPGLHHSHAAEPRAVIGDVDSILDCWEWASKQHEVPTRTQRENRHLSVSTSLNGHAAIAVEQLAGVIVASRLREQFEWRLIEQAGKQLCVEAVPRDETERLFFRSIRVWLNPSSWRIEQLQAIDRHGVQRVNWLAEPVIATASYVSTVAAVDDVIPPSPKLLDGEVGLSRMNVDQPVSRLFTRFVPLNGVDEPDPIEPSPVTPELAAILDKWEATLREIKTAKLKFQHTVYNKVFETETRSDGELFYMAPDKFGVVLRPDRIVGNQRGKPPARGLRIGTSGHPFRLEEGRAESWFLTQNELVFCDDEDKTYAYFLVPRKDVSRPLNLWDATHGRLMRQLFLFGNNADGMRTKWTFKLSGVSKDSVLLVATPREVGLKRFVSECWILVNTNTWQTSAVKYVDSAGTVESVYKINDREINVVLPHNCFSPDLKARGYKLVIAPKSE